MPLPNACRMVEVEVAEEVEVELALLQVTIRAEATAAVLMAGRKNLLRDQQLRNSRHLHQDQKTILRQVGRVLASNQAVA